MKTLSFSFRKLGFQTRLVSARAGLLLAASVVLPCSAADPFTKVTTGALVTSAGRHVGASWGDYDGDGFIDLFIARMQYEGNRLYHNNGDGTFTLATNTVSAGADLSHCGVWGDYDNDGDLDLYVGNGTVMGARNNFFYQNNGDGSFTAITSGILVTTPANSGAVAWGDYDRDGFLDMFVSNYGGQQNWLLHNAGDGTFTRIIGQMAEGGVSVGCAWADFQGDGWLDLIVANAQNQACYLYRNNSNGTFSRVMASPLGTDTGGYWIGVDWGDYDNDGDLDLYLSAYNGANRLYRAEAGGTFSSVASPVVGAGSQSLHPAWGDYDNDGWLDLYISRGEEQATQSRLYHNRGDGTFEMISQSVAVMDSVRSAGCAWGDYDNDGFLDLLVSRGGFFASQPCALFHNNGNTNAWLKIKLVGSRSNRAGIGARVRIRAVINGQELWQLREISGGSGGGGQNSMVAHFGLGDAGLADQVRIEWPSGTVQEFGPVIARQTLTITEPPRIESVSRPATDSVRLQVESWAGLTYRVDASSDLMDWAPLGEAVAMGGQVEVSDPQAASAAQRFYCLAVPRLETLAAFAPPNLPEGLTVDDQGNAYVSMSQTGEIWKIVSGGAHSVLASLQGMVTGMTVDELGQVFVAVLTPAPGDPSVHGVWRVQPDGTTERYAALPLDSFPNDVVFGPDGLLYATDSAGGRVFRIAADGTASEWISMNPLLLGNPSPPPPQPYPVGANGMAFFGDSAYICNTDSNTIVRVPVQLDGSAGAPEILLSDPRLYGADGLRVDANGNQYVANVMQSLLLRITPERHIETLATTRGGLDSPSSLCFGSGLYDRTKLYLVNYAIIQALIPGGQPRPSLMRMDVGVPGLAVP